MINFATKLDGALSLLEMAQLAHKHVDIGEPNIIDYRVILGPNKLARSLPLDASTSTMADAEAAAKQMLNTDLKGWLPETYRDSFGVDSFEELVKSATVEPVYDSGSFNKQDRKALLNPVTWRKIEAYLNNNPAGYKWAILAYDRTRLRRQLHKGEAIPDYIKRTSPEIDYDNTITFAKLASTGDPLDADMFIHTAAHAVLDHDLNRGTNQQINDVIEHYRRTVFKALDYGYPEDDEITPDVDAIDEKKSERIDGGGGTAEDVFSMFCHFNAALNTLKKRDITLDERTKAYAKKRSILDKGELVHEMMSIFIKRNRVKIAPNEYCFIKSPRLIAKALQIGEYINTEFKTCLDNCVGQIIIDT